MDLLLDTHTFLWFAFGDSSLSPLARRLITDPANDPVVSLVTPWEIAIKFGKGRLHLTQPYPLWITNQLSQLNASLMRIEFDDVAQVAALPLYHGDPFDHMLIAQALVRHLPIVSVDTAFDAYDVTRLW